MSAVLLELHSNSLVDIAACLRVIADNIESGEYGEVLRSAVVLRAVGRVPQVFGHGKTDAVQTFMDLHAGAAEILSMKSPGRGP